MYCSSITFGGTYFLLVILAVNPLTGSVKAQKSADTTEVIRIPVNTDCSSIAWKGTEMWQSGGHEGTVKLSTGHLLLKDDKIIGGEFVADMHLISITDIPRHDPVPRRRLRNHLKSEDFFYVDEYPDSHFNIINTENLTADSLEVQGNLTIRDVTKKISFTASRRRGQKTGLVFYATFKIDRFAWNISYQGSYWERITSILDDTFVDADILLSVKLCKAPEDSRAG